MMNLNQKFVITSAGLLALIGGVVVLFWNLSGHVGRLSAELQESESAIADLEEERTAAGMAEAVMESHTEDIDRINGFFIDRERPIAFIEEVERLARLTRNKILLAVDEAPAGTNALVFRMSLDGTPESVRSFVEIADALPYGIGTERMSYQRGLGATSARLDLAIRVLTR